MKQYDGHRSWNAANVALYISNEESIYTHAVACLRATRTLDQAVTRFCNESGLLGMRTPDGARYNRLSIKLALEGLEVEQGS